MLLALREDRAWKTYRGRKCFVLPRKETKTRIVKGEEYFLDNGYDIAFFPDQDAWLVVKDKELK